RRRQALVSGRRQQPPLYGRAARMHTRTWGHTSRPHVLPTVSRVDLDSIRLMGVAEIAERLQLSRDRAGKIATRRDFPAPRWRLRMGQVWLADDVDAWVSEHRPHLD